jgi:hypothetical protein
MVISVIIFCLIMAGMFLFKFPFLLLFGKKQNYYIFHNHHYVEVT